MLSRAGKGIGILLWLVSSGLLAQQEDFSWWNTKHQWDGVTHWKQYLNLAPAYMGPNALPVPDLRDPAAGSSIRLDLAAEAYVSAGDHTTDLFTRLLVPVVRNRVALEVYGVPVEYYVTDTLVRDRRRSREYDGKGFSVGDVYVGTLVQLLADHEKWPDLVLGITLKVPSARNIAGARYTDTPAYFFDLAAGKKISRYLSLRAMAGFYSWQTNDPQHAQNDAFLYGVGTACRSGSFLWEQDLSGYAGYLGPGDDPLIYRTGIGMILGNHELKLEYLAGLHDFPFHRLRILYGINFGE